MAHPADEPQVSHLRLRPAASDVDPAVIAEAEQHEMSLARKALPQAPDAVHRYYAGVLNGSVIHELSVLRSLGLALPQEWSASVFPEIGEGKPASLLASAAVGEMRV